MCVKLKDYLYLCSGIFKTQKLKEMKRICVIILILIQVLTCAGQSQKMTRQQKKYMKLAEKLDVLNYLPKTCDRNPSTFWNAVTKNNIALQEVLEKFKDPKDLAREAMDKVQKAKNEAFFMNISYDEDKEGRVNNAFRAALLGESCIDDDIVFRIWPESELNAFVTADGYIYINVGMMEKLDGSYDMVNAVLAHEVTHYMFRHMLVHEYMALKRKMANSIGAAIALIGTTVAVASGGGGIDDSFEKNLNSIVEGANEWSKAYYYRYGREEEFESDIVAYRFLEWTGRNPEACTKALATISGPWTGKESDRYDDHPSPEERISVLRALKPAPFRKLAGTNSSDESPSYDVYICTRGQDTKYHSISNCSNLVSCSKDIQKIDPELAEDKGYEPCEICYK